ncbi:MAG: hypothetical protein ACFFE8_03985 [Candidatus Heimdallarchaeota archaeon]
MVDIPNFNPVKAEEYLESHAEKPYFQLLYMRDVLDLGIQNSEYLEKQDRFLSQKRISRFMNKQLNNGSWLEPGKDGVWSPMHKSTVWTLLFLGYLGVNGLSLPNIGKAVDYVFATKIHQEEYVFREDHKVWGHFMQCENSMLLRSLLLMGFGEREDVKRASFKHLKRIHGKEGLCYYKKGPLKSDRMKLPCGWGLIKDLLFLNEWPERWKQPEYKKTISSITRYILSHDLTKADFPRLKQSVSSKWHALAYFRSYYADIFELVEALTPAGKEVRTEIQGLLKSLGSLCQDYVTWICGITPTWRIQLEKLQEPSPWLTIKGLKLSNL